MVSKVCFTWWDARQELESSVYPALCSPTNDDAAFGLKKVIRCRDARVVASDSANSVTVDFKWGVCAFPCEFEDDLLEF